MGDSILIYVKPKSKSDHLLFTELKLQYDNGTKELIKR